MLNRNVQIVEKYSLTDKQYKLLSLVMEGYTNAEIERMWGVKEKATKGMLRVLYNKFGLPSKGARESNRMRLMSTVFKQGWSFEPLPLPKAVNNG